MEAHGLSRGLFTYKSQSLSPLYFSKIAFVGANSRHFAIFTPFGVNLEMAIGTIPASIFFIFENKSYKSFSQKSS